MAAGRELEAATDVEKTQSLGFHFFYLMTAVELLLSGKNF